MASRNVHPDYSVPTVELLTPHGTKVTVPKARAESLLKRGPRRWGKDAKFSQPYKTADESHTPKVDK